MNSLQNPNLDKVEIAVNKLGDLVENMVFSGAVATGMLITDATAPCVRVVRDMELIVKVNNLQEYISLADELRAKEFVPDENRADPISRWVSGDIILELASTDPKIMGFGSQWYESAMEKAELIQLPSESNIKRVSSPYFLIIKLDAFLGFGSGDYLRSPDVEDIIAVLDGRPEVVKEIKILKKSDPDVVKQLSNGFNEFLKNSQFVEAVSAYMPTIETSHDRVTAILKRIVEIAELR